MADNWKPISKTDNWTPLSSVDLSGMRTERNAIAAGVSSGVDDLQGLGYSGIAAVADTFGADRVKNWANEQADRNELESRRNGRPDLEKIEDVYDKPSKYLPYLGYQLGKQGSNIVGGIAAGMLLPEAAVPAVVSRGLALMPRMLGGGGARAAAAEGIDAAAAAVNTGKMVGKQLVGGAAWNYGQSVGSLYQAAQEGGDMENAGPKSLLGGVPYALLETAPEAGLIGRLGAGHSFQGGLAKRVAKAGGLQAATGATSELGQTAMENAYNGHLTPEQTQSSYLNAGAAGGLVEGVLGSFGGIRRHRAPGVNEPNTPIDFLQPDAPPRQLGLDPSVRNPDQVGQDTYYTFPDGSTALNSDAALAARNAPQLGSRDSRREARMPGPDDMPAVAQVDGLQNAAGTNADNVLMNDPGAIAARQQLIEQRQRAQGVKAQADQVAASVEERNQRAAAVGLDPKKEAVFNLFGQLEDAHNDGDITDVQLAENLGMLKASKLGTVRKFLKGMAAQNEATTQSAAADKQTALDALQPKAPDATTASANVAATPNVPVRPDANAPAATATPAPAAASVSVAPANAQPKATTKAVPAGPTAGSNVPVSAAQRATNALKAVGRSPEQLIAVTRNRKTVNVTALSLWTNLLNNPKALRRAQQSMGADADWNVVNSPMSFADIGAGEGTSRQAVSKQMLGFGITESTVDAAVASDGNMASRPGVGLEEESDETGATPVPKTSDDNVQAAPASETETEGGTDYTGGAGYRVESTPAKAMGEGLVQGTAETRAQRTARVKADELLSINKDLDRAVTAKSAEDTRQELENQRRADAKYAAMLQHPKADEARVDWDEIKQTDSPDFSELVPQIRAAWVDLHSTQVAETGNEYTPIKKLVERFEKDLEDGDYTKISSDTNVSGRTAGVDRQAAGDAAGRADPAGKNDAAVQPGASRAVESGETGARSTAAQPTVVTKKRRTIERSDAPDSRGRSDAGQLRTELAKFIRVDALGRSVVVVQSAEDLPMGAGEAQSLGVNNRTQAFVLGNQAFLIADNIAAGKGKAVFMHEVGSHLGLQNMLSEGEFKQLVNTVAGWVDGKAGPEAQQIARRAMARVASAKTEAAQYNTELVAYTIEEAITAGYNPLAAGNEGPIKAFMRSVMQMFKSLVTKLGLKPEKFTVQDLVDMAYGAAQAVPGIDSQKSVSAGPSEGVQFSQAADLPSVTKSQAAMSSAFKEAMTSAGEIGSSLLKKAVFTHDLIDMAAKVLPAAKSYLANVNAVNTEKIKLSQAVQDVVADFRALTAVEQGMGPLSVNSFLHDSTARKAWGYAPAGKPNTVVDPALAARYKLMTPAAQAAIAKVFAHNDNVRTQLIAADTATVNREFAADIAAAKAKGYTEEAAKLTEAHKLALKGVGKGLEGDWPYTPMSRFGSHVVLATSARYMAAVEAGDKAGAAALESDAAHYHVDRTDSMRSARELADRLRANFPGGHVTSFERGPEDSVVYGGRDALGVMTRLRHLVRDSADDNPGLDKDANKAIDKMMRDLHLQLLSETSARKSQMSRVTVAGANKDMMRSFAGYGQSMAHYIATLNMGGAVQDSLDTMKGQAEAHTSGDTERRAYFNEILRRHVLNMSYEPNATVEKIMASSSVWSLLTNPAHHLMQALQTVMISLPQMAGKHGYARAASTLTTAYRDLGPIVRGGSFKEADFGKLPKDVQAMARALTDRGIIGMDQGLELGSFESAPDGKTHIFSTVVGKLRNVAESIEAVNRLSTAMAAYRMEINRGATEQAATDYAYQVVYDTHGDYTGFNAPRFMRAGLGRIATQFRKFQLIQLTLYTKLIYQSFKGAGPEERAIAKKALAFNLSHLLVMGGTLALPGFSTIAWVLGKAFGDDDTPDDVEATMRRAIKDKPLADLLTHGIPKLLGMNLTQRLGAGDILSPMPYAEPDLSRKGYASALMGAAGPFVGGLLPRAFDGLGLMSQSLHNGQSVDFYKGLEQLMPNGMGNLMKAARYQVDGVSQRNGDVTLKPEDISVMDSMAQAFGLPTNGVTDRNFLNQTLYKAKDFYKERGEQIKRSYVEAYKDNDAQTMTEARGRWQDMQAALKDQGYAVQPLSTLLKAPMEAIKRERSTMSGVEVNKRTKGVVDLLEQ